MARATLFVGVVWVACGTLAVPAAMQAAEWKTSGVAADVAPPLPIETPLNPAEAAARVDQLLSSELHSADTALTKQADDETFLRRATLDLIGELPTPESVTAFVLDNSPDKRTALVEHLLADRLYGQNWARYWRDVMLYRRSDDRALISSVAAVNWLTEQFNANTRWDQIARELITAEGNLLEAGDTVLIASQWGQIPETAAEVSRVLMGIQIQCANCHNHPTDRWNRQQFHELAAFFPRIAVRRAPDDGGRRTFEVASLKTPKRPAAKNNPKAKAKKGPPDREHYMPDLEDPSAKGTLMTPKFFVNGQTLPLGSDDLDRRAQLAAWITARENPWFAKAIVNRLWAELVGEGFYEPVDDLGPDRQASAPQTIDFLAGQFVAHDYDVKWLLATIASTSAYQRESRTRREPDETPFVANCPQRLRADQLFNVLSSALELPDRPERAGRPAALAQAAQNGGRLQMISLFGFDPSDPRDEVTGAIDQALLLMNSPLLHTAIGGRNSRTMLGKLLAENDDNEMVVVELYLRCLAREPQDDELRTCLAHIRKSPSRAEGCEDVLWALINSTEFLYRN
ncbi:MAG: DUF1549 and DUF1553 domain-containing protein [Pirellulales bacterium]|nr:DUF1549 and DUF1553 domain-containing protein [Pirellulales bacterium]